MKAKEITNTKHKRASVDSQRDRTPQVILELSLPDNELFGTFTDESCHRQRGFPQMLLYKPTEKLPDSPQPVKTAHRKEVILRARDLNMFVQQLHCYIRRPKGKDTGSHVHRSVSTITRSSVQGNPSQDAPKTKARREKSTIQLRVKVSPQKTEVVTDKEILHIKARESVSEELSENNSTDSSATSHQVDKRLPGSVEENKKTVKAPQRLKMVAKQKRKLKEKPNAPKERVCCPMNGCQWFTDLSKNRVKPLERTPRYPCLHQGCTARFKTGNEMRRHTRKHSPLQAVCCVPGCPKLFICLWALNLHERDHYSKKSSKTNKNSHQQKDYKCDPKQNQTTLRHKRQKQLI
uniref:C2H2-type domain-containing protein n=1 Tax=Gouania willdenowi TaxID=441366 RepID=A0A8C5GCK6_GOUWI